MINVIADRYAQALFEVGEETQTTSELYQELSELVDILNENKDLYNFLKSPLIGIEDKKNVMQNIFKNQLSNSMNNFLKVVIDKDRMSTIEYIKESYKSLLNDKNNILEGTAITAVELSEKEIKDLEKNLSIIREVLQTIQDIIFNHDLPNTKENENQEFFLASCVCPSCKENVGTVHTFQGAERNVIIFSSVYGSEEGCYFINSNKSLMNVAVSRAKDSFLVFGDSGCLEGNPKSAGGMLKRMTEREII